MAGMSLPGGRETRGSRQSQACSQAPGHWKRQGGLTDTMKSLCPGPAWDGLPREWLHGPPSVPETSFSQLSFTRDDKPRPCGEVSKASMTRPQRLREHPPPAGLGPTRPVQDSSLCPMEARSSGSGRLQGSASGPPCPSEAQRFLSPTCNHRGSSLLPSLGRAPACSPPHPWDPLSPSGSARFLCRNGHLQRPQPSLSQGHLVLRAHPGLLPPAFPDFLCGAS